MLLTVVLAVTSILMLSVPSIGIPFAFAGNPQDGKGMRTEVIRDGSLPPGIVERVFIHLPKSRKTPSHLGTCSETSNDTANSYGLTGWHIPATGIKWKLNPSTVPSAHGLTASQAEAALKTAFQHWTTADGKKMFEFDGTTSVKVSKLDFVNTVMWRRLSTGAIAITYVRYYTSTGVVADIDTVFNLRYPWAIFDATNGECQGNPDAYDLEDIATHEFGHWVGLNDLYAEDDQDLTMYGYGAGGELKKRTLGTGDVTGVTTVAP